MPIKTYLTNKLNSTRFRLNGLVPSERLPNKSQLRLTFRDHVLYSPGQLPPKVDLRSDMTPVENQSAIGSCSANTLAGAYEYLTKKANGRDTDVSRLFIYYNARVKDQNTQSVSDSGCTMTSAIESLEEYGTCLESVWPYDISRVNTRPNDQSYQEANHHKITEALRVNIDLNEMKSCLAQGFPFAFGLKLYASFDQAATTGVVPMPNVSDSSRQADGNHALLAVGYSDQSNAFIVRNSWGENWGDRGYCYIPYDYITNSQYSFDVWTVRKLATNDFGQGHWSENDMIDYSKVNRNYGYNNRFDDNSRAIESYHESDNNYARRNHYDSPWNQYGSYGGNNYSRNDDDDYYPNPWNQYESYRGNNYSRNDDYGNPSNQYGIYRRDDYSTDDDDRRGNYPNPWNQNPSYRGNNYSRNDDYGNPSNQYGSYRRDDYSTDDDDRRGNYSDPWNQYESYRGNNYSRNDDYGNPSNQYGMYRRDDYSTDDDDRRGNYPNPWNQDPAYRGNNYSRNDDYGNPSNQYGSYRGNDYSTSDDDRRDNYPKSWNQDPTYSGNDYSTSDDDRRDNYRKPWNQDPTYRENTYSRDDDFNQFREPFGGGFPNFNPFAPPPAFQNQQPYGFNYGYTSPYNNYSNPYFR